MQFRKSSLTGKLIILLVVACAAAALISLRSQLASQKAENAAAQQTLAAVTQQNASAQPLLEDLQSYQKRFTNLVNIAGDFADPKAISAGLTSEAMEAAAHKAGYLLPGEIVFANLND